RRADPAAARAGWGPEDVQEPGQCDRHHRSPQRDVRQGDVAAGPADDPVFRVLHAGAARRDPRAGELTRLGPGASPRRQAAVGPGDHRAVPRRAGGRRRRSGVRPRLRVPRAPRGAPRRHAAPPSPARGTAPARAAAPGEGQDLPPGLYRRGLAVIAALGALLRVAHIARPFNGISATAWNEGHYALIALNFDRYGLLSQHNELGLDRTFSPGVPWLMWAAFRLFGPSEWAARLPVVVFGIAAIPLAAALIQRLFRSEQIALIAAGFVAAIPGTVYYAQNAQLDTPSICCALAGAVALSRYVDGRRWGELVRAGAWVTLAVWLKFTTALLYPAFLGLWWPARPRRPLSAVAM